MAVPKDKSAAKPPVGLIRGPVKVQWHISDQARAARTRDGCLPGRRARAQPTALAALEAYGRGRIVTVAATGQPQTDCNGIRAAANGSVDLAFDMVDGARDPNMTLAALRSLRREGRLVLMGSMTADLPVPYTEVMLNGWEIIGQFMYPRDAYRRLLSLAGTGALDFATVRPLVYGIADLNAAIDRAAAAAGLQRVLIDHEGNDKDYEFSTDSQSI